MNAPLPPRKTLAWNGVSLQVPRSWDSAEFQAFALSVAGRDGQGLDLRWARTKGSFDPQAHLARVAAAMGPGAVADPDPAALPPGWAGAGQALAAAGLAVLPFAWRAGDGAGPGAVLHNPATGLAALARFTLPGPAPEQDMATALAVLDSLGDHPPGGPVPWAAFGVTAVVPGDLELRAFSFTPGHFRLTLAAPHTGCELVLDRLGPADALLGRRTLAQYADAFYGTLGAPEGFFSEAPASAPGLPEAAPDAPDAPPPGAAPARAPEPDMVAGSGFRPAPLLARLLRRPWPGARRGRLWRAGIGAMLLGAFMRAPRERDLEAFEAICRDYALDRP